VKPAISKMKSLVSKMKSDRDVEHLDQLEGVSTLLQVEACAIKQWKACYRNLN
jgi:hypothetical protein